MQPGIARAVPMGVVGFVLGALLAIVIRLAQGLDPNPDTPYAFVGPAVVLGSLLSAGLFIWGIGGFDPRMSAHGEAEGEHDHDTEHAEAEVPEKPLALLGGFTWQVTFWVILALLAIGIFAFLPFGPAIQSVNQPEGNPAAIGMTALGDIYNPVREFVQTASGIVLPPLASNLAGLKISHLVVFVIFVAWTLFSLFLVAGVLGFLINYLSRGAKNPEAVVIPWRALGFVLLVGGLVQLPLLVPNLSIPMPMIMPIFLLAPLLLFIVFRHPLFLLLLLALLPLPLLLPTVSISQIGLLFLLLLSAAVVVVLVNGARMFMPENLYRPAAGLILALTLVALVVLPVAAAAPDFWQIITLVILALLGAWLLLPLWFLKLIVPAPLWARFAAVRWGSLIPDFSRWMAGVLRGAPRFLGQR